VHEALEVVVEDKRADMNLRVAGLWDRRRFGKGDEGGGGLKVVVMRFGESPVSQAADVTTITQE
jgi:hypothetical protein